MLRINIYHKYGHDKYDVVEKINKKLFEFDLEIELIKYDDNMVYRTGERQLDTRIDGAIMRA